jgi:ketosteroid isomerase-like protein
MDAQAAARAWIDGWSRAWPAKDDDLVASLYADDASFRSLPFRKAHRGPEGARQYARSAFVDEEDVHCWFGEPFVAGDRATIEYWATLVEGGKDVSIAGVALLRFASDGRVADQRDYWAIADGRRERPEGWGR